ncbi:MAG: DUF6493 family protein [Candidatus Sericytochromatia bacterium]
MSRKKFLVFCQNLTIEERKYLNENIKKDLLTLKSACKFDTELSKPPKSSITFNTETLINSINNIFSNIETKVEKIPDIDTFYEGIYNNIDNLESYLKNNKINFYFHPNSGNLFFKIQMLNTSILEVKSLYPLFKLKQNDFLPSYNNETPYYEYILKVLLVRTETKIDEIIIKFFTEIEKLYSLWQVEHFKGLAKLILYVIEKKPHLEKNLEIYLGKCLVLDTQEKDLAKYPKKMIYEALKYDSTNDDIPNIISNHYFTRKKEVLELLNKGLLDRNLIIELILSKLSKPYKKSVISEWNKFYDDLNISKEEKLNYQDYYFNLIASINSTSIQLGIKEVKNFIKDKVFNGNYEELIQNLSHNLNNIVKKIAEDSFKLLKSIFNDKKEYKELILDNMVKNIYVLDKNFRLNLIEFITSNNLTEDNKKSLLDFYNSESLNNVEKSLIENVIENFEPIEKKEVKILEKISNKTTLDTSINNTRNILPVYKKNYLQLQEVLKNNNYDLIKTIDIDSPFCFGEKIAFSEDESTIAIKMKDMLRRWDIYNDYEIIFYEILKNRTIKNKDKLLKQLAPIFDFHDKSEENKQFYNTFHHKNIILCMLSYYWIKDESLKKYSYENLKELIEPSSSINRSTLRLFFVVKKILENKLDLELLSTPVYKSGWIDLNTFSERFEKMPEAFIELDDLILALLRVENHLKDDNKLKEKILLKANTLKNEYLKKALIIKFADNDLVNKEIEFFTDYFIKNPPDDIILVKNYYNNFSDNNPSQKNQLFRLFNTALISRFGLIDLTEKFPNLEKIDLGNLIIHNGIEYPIFNPQNIIDNMEQSIGLNIQKPIDYNITNINNFKDEAKAKFLKNFFWGKEKDYSFSCDISNYAENKEIYLKKYYPYYDINSKYLDKLLLDSFNFYDKKYVIYYPQILLYMCFSFEVSNLSPKEIIYLDSWRFPQLPQYIFDFNCEKIKKMDFNTIGKSDFTPKNLASGEFLQVNLSKNLETLCLLLTSKHSEIKEISLNIINEAFKIGRITYKNFIDIMVRLLINTSTGFKYLKESLEAISLFSSTHEKIIILILEKYIEIINNENNNKNLSIILDVYNDLLVRSNRSIESNLVFEKLKILSESKKKTPIKDKSKIILSISNNNIESLDKGIINGILNEIETTIEI